MLKTLRGIMDIAEEKACAIGSFNTPNLESLEAVIGAAEELCRPVIIQFAQCHEPWIPLSRIGPIMVETAKQSTVPVCVHLDHGETLEYLKQALEIGFNSVMFDGSALPYEENLQLTKNAVELAKAYGADVEGELGSMGRRESGSGDAAEDDLKIYTDPDMAASFVSETGIDALACSFGTTHGIYISQPRLDFEIVKQVREKTAGIPVVMHGGSGVSRDDFRTAIEAGVRKVNYFTYMDKAGGERVKSWLKSEPDPVFFSDIAMQARSAMKENVKDAIKMFSLD